MPAETAPVEEQNKVVSKGIYRALLGIMAEIGAIGKDSYNEGQRYHFRGIDDVYNTLNPPMVKPGVFCLPRVTDIHREERASKQGGILIYTVVHVDYEFCAADESSVTVHVMGEAMDSGDKSLNKAMSAAQKYALLQMFCIPTEEQKDADHDSPELAAGAPKQAPEGAKACPECGKSLRLRTKKGTTDQFWGCSGYPYCIHTAPVEGDTRSWWVRVTAALKGTDITTEGFKRWIVAMYEVGSSKDLTEEQKREILQKLNDPDGLQRISDETQQLRDAQES